MKRDPAYKIVKFVQAALFLYLAAIFSICFFARPVLAAPSLTDYGKLPTVDNVKISPNGDLIAFRRTRGDNDDSIVVFSIKKQKLLNGINVSKLDPRDFYFYSDSYLILVASQRKQLLEYKEALDISSAFSFNIKSGELEQLVVPGKGLSGGHEIYRGQSGIGRVMGKTQDAKHLFIPAYVSDSNSNQNPGYSLLKINIEGRGAPRIVDYGNAHVDNYFINKNGLLLARETYNHRSNMHKIDRYDNGIWENIFLYEAKLRVHDFVGLTPDEKSIVVLFTHKKDNTNSYWTLSLANGKMSRLPYDRKDADIESTISDNINGIVYGLRYSGLTPDYKFFNPDLDNRIQKILKLFPEHSVLLNDWTPDWENLIVEVAGPSYAREFYLIDKRQKPTYIASAYDSIDETDINPLGVVVISATDKLPITNILTLPRAKMNSLKNLPTIMLPHGGPASYDKIGFDFMAQALASRGYLVVQPQFRGSRGFGWDFYAAGFGEWGGKMQQDLSDSLQSLIAKGLVDPSRICIVGASYGGYSALAGATFSPDLYKCAVSIAGISHLPEFLLSKKRRHGRKHSVLDYFEKTLGGGEFESQALKDISPYYAADKVKIPVLLIHGEDDDVVEFKQSTIMYRALKKLGKQVSLIKLENEDHYLREGSTRQQTLEEALKFIEKHLGSGV